MPIPRIVDYVGEPPQLLVAYASQPPWEVASETESILKHVIVALADRPDEYEVDGQRVVHRSAVVHESAVVTEPAIIEADASVGPHCRLRGGVYVGNGATIGASSEVKSSWIMARTALAHLNYVGNSIVGEDVNLEAGAVIANHFNERDDKQISVLFDGAALATGLTKFGAAIGSGSRIGANAVTTPGTLLLPNSIVNRLELVDQLKSD